MAKSLRAGLFRFYKSENKYMFSTRRKIITRSFLGKCRAGRPTKEWSASESGIENPSEIHRGNREVLLVRAEDIECVYFRFPAESLTMGESPLHIFILTCETLGFEDLVCDHGCYKSANKDRHKVLDESEMFMMFVEFPTPLNLYARNVLKKVKFPRKYPPESHH